METSDLMGLVIRSLGTIVGKMVRDERTNVDGYDGCTKHPENAVDKKQYMLLTTLITSAAQQIAEVEEIDISNELITTKRVGQLLNKMRLPRGRQSAGGKRGWFVSLHDVLRWANSYGLDPAKITGIQPGSLPELGTPVISVISVRPAGDMPFNRLRGEI